MRAGCSESWWRSMSQNGGGEREDGGPGDERELLVDPVCETAGPGDSGGLIDNLGGPGHDDGEDEFELWECQRYTMAEIFGKSHYPLRCYCKTRVSA